jgi:DNA gyrase subunit B
VMERFIEQEYEKGKALYPVKQIGETTKKRYHCNFYPDPSIFLRKLLNILMILCQHVCVNCLFLNKGISITFTDKREKIKMEILLVKFFTEGLKEYIRYLDWKP